MSGSKDMKGAGVRRLAVGWFEWPAKVRECETKADLDLAEAQRRFCAGEYEEFLSSFARRWSSADRTERAAIICKWLPNLYLRYVGLANITIAFDLYEMAGSMTEQAKKLANVLARLICAHKRANEEHLESKRLSATSIHPMLRLPDEELQILSTAQAINDRKPPPNPFSNPFPPPVGTASGPHRTWAAAIAAAAAAGEAANGAQRSPVSTAAAPNAGAAAAPTGFLVPGFSELWTTPLSTIEKTVNDEKGGGGGGGGGGGKEEKGCSSSDALEMAMYQNEWTRLMVGSSIVRESGVTRENLFQLAIWLERARGSSGLDAGIFLHCMDVMTSFHSNTKPGNFLSPLIDPDGSYARTLRLFIRTIRGFLLQDIGDRLYSIFYWLVVTRCIDSAAKRPEHHHPGMMLKFSELDSIAPETVVLAQAIAASLKANPQAKDPTKDEKMIGIGRSSLKANPSSSSNPNQSDDGKVVEGGGMGLPASGASLGLLAKMDWGHPFAQDWVRGMEGRFSKHSHGRKKSAASTGAAKGQTSLDADQQALQEHLNSMDAMADQEWKRQLSGKLEEVDEGLIAPLPQIRWGDTYKASVDVDGRVWVGPFSSQSAHQNRMVGRALFRARKLAEWRLNHLTITPIKKRQAASAEEGGGAPAAVLYFLRYDRLPVNAAQITSLRSSMNLTRANVIDVSALEMYDVGQITQHNFIRMPAGANANYCHGYAQIIGLQVARAILGVLETEFKRDTIATLNSTYVVQNVLPTACFLQRNVQSYRASFSTLHKMAKQRALRQQPPPITLSLNPPQIGTKDATAAAAATPPPVDTASLSKWLVNCFGKRGAVVVVERGRRKREAGHTTDVKTAFSSMQEADVRAADTMAILFGKPIDKKTGIHGSIRADLHRANFMLDTRPRLGAFFNALKNEKELPHIRSILTVIHKTLPLLLPPDVTCAFHIHPTSH